MSDLKPSNIVRVNKQLWDQLRESHAAKAAEIASLRESVNALNIMAQDQHTRRVELLQELGFVAEGLFSHTDTKTIQRFIAKHNA